MIFIRRLIGAVTILAGLFAASSAWACSCYRVEPDEFARHVAILFEGRLVRIETVSPANPFSAPETATMVPPESLEGVFSVQHVYKGDLGAEVRIRYWGNHGGDCGTFFAPLKTVTVAARSDPEIGYVTNMCVQAPVSHEPFRTQVLDAVKRHQERLTEGDEPQ